MKTKFSIVFFQVMTFAAMFVLGSSCAENQKHGCVNDPRNGELILRDTTNYNTGAYTKDIQTTEDGYSLVILKPSQSIITEFYQFYSPHGNLLMVGTDGSEACCINGFRIDYATDGKVSCVNYVGVMSDELYEQLLEGRNGAKVMKEWMDDTLEGDPEEHYEILRDENGEVIQIGTVEVPCGYKADYYLSGWGPFWVSDIMGGCIGFFVVLKSEETEGSYVNYVYCCNQILAELAYWKGTFIAARTYNRHGLLVGEYTDRDMDVQYQTFEDYRSTPDKWYVK